MTIQLTGPICVHSCTDSIARFCLENNPKTYKIQTINEFRETELPKAVIQRFTAFPKYVSPYPAIHHRTVQGPTLENPWKTLLFFQGWTLEKFLGTAYHRTLTAFSDGDASRLRSNLHRLSPLFSNSQLLTPVICRAGSF